MQIKNIALMIFLIFIIILFLLSQFVGPRTIKIFNIKRINLNEKVKIVGFVNEIIHKSNITIIKINDSTGMIYGVIYDTIDIEKNVIYAFVGKIKEYNQDFELEIEKIEIV